MLSGIPLVCVFSEVEALCPDCMVDIMQEILDKMNQARRKHIPFTHVANWGH